MTSLVENLRCVNYGYICKSGKNLAIVSRTLYNKDHFMYNEMKDLRSEENMYQIDDNQKHQNVKFAQRKQDESVRELGKKTMKKFVREYANKEEMLALIAKYNERSEVEKIEVIE